MISVHMVKKYERKDIAEKDGTVYDYSMTVKYYPKVYFRDISASDFAEWLRDSFWLTDILLYIPEDNSIGEFWEIGKDVFRKVLADKELQGYALNSDYVPSFVTDDREKELCEFLLDAVNSETSDDIVRIELW